MGRQKSSPPGNCLSLLGGLRVRGPLWVWPFISPVDRCMQRRQEGYSSWRERRAQHGPTSTVLRSYPRSTHAEGKAFPQLNVLSLISINQQGENEPDFITPLSKHVVCGTQPPPTPGFGQTPAALGNRAPSSSDELEGPAGPAVIPVECSTVPHTRPDGADEI